MAAALAALPFDIGAALGSLTDETIGDVRAAMAQMPVPPLTDKVLRTDHEIPGSGGVVVRVHRPVDVKGPLPCVYWMHGGGLVLGDYAGDDARFDVWCPQLACVGVSVQYRLSPETKYPGPLDDCYAGLAWVHQHAAELGVDPARLGVGGQSAGAGLAAGLALPGPRPGRGAAGVPAADLPDARRPPDHDVEPVAGSGVAAERQHVRLDRVPRRPQGHRRRRAVRRAGAGRPTSPGCRRR